MKALLRKRWFRITTSIVLAAAILLGAAVLIANRRGAELLQQELAAARAAGLPLTRAEMDAGLPPPERNAALHGILHEWELAMARPDEPGAKERSPPASPRRSRLGLRAACCRFQAGNPVAVKHGSSLPS